MEQLLEVRGLGKSFGPITAVDDITFSVERGELVGFLGPNGAGKTTTMRMIAGYLMPSRGTAAVCGADVRRAPLAARARLGYLAEGAPAYGEMTPAALLEFVGKVRGLPAARRRARREEVVARLELAEVMHRPIDTLSKGFRRRVGLAQALLHDPDVVILDEPTDGLDPNQKHQVREMLKGIARDKAIIISTHILEEVEAICSRAIVISEGRMVADARPDELERRSRLHNAVSLRIQATHERAARTVLGDLGDVESVETAPAFDGGVRIVAFPRDGRPILGPVREALAGAGVPVDELFVERGRLDEVFRRLTRAA